MHYSHLDQQIMAALLRYLAQPGDRHFTRLYRLIEKHPQLNRNQRQHYHQELFKEAVQEAWLILYQRNLQHLLHKLEIESTAIAPENATKIVTAIIKHLNRLIRNKNVDLYRKETYSHALSREFPLSLNYAPTSENGDRLEYLELLASSEDLWENCYANEKRDRIFAIINDPQWQAEHPRNRPQFNLAAFLDCKYQEMTYQAIAKKLEVTFGYVASHGQRKFQPILKKLLQDLEEDL